MCHTLEAMHFGIVELWSTFFCSDSSKASASISPASEASATYLFLLFLFQKREKKPSLGPLPVQCTILCIHVLSKY